jgi:hypothetical protein
MAAERFPESHSNIVIPDLESEHQVFAAIAIKGAQPTARIVSKACKSTRLKTPGINGAYK